ncbi:hypothetical protein KsCSTR_35920 [Candidatus Kuenenia stuttgartiensis]|uniref:Uncharacterized protein n=1 Tax=Kuenenia stuttgartiensis TaxID=174633 RepID=Q1Q6L9_KUEST|nr:hypothetical protein KsCSTR_35920 [Candidatus Kuenenia stuttgartiensis]CAJ73223.1 unknown protein [Candidatus Kuenenia stuttgartiensis]
MKLEIVICSATRFVALHEFSGRRYQVRNEQQPIITNASPLHYAASSAIIGIFQKTTSLLQRAPYTI